jgi:hypothetical protein
MNLEKMFWAEVDANYALKKGVDNKVLILSVASPSTVWTTKIDKTFTELDVSRLKFICFSDEEPESTCNKCNNKLDLVSALTKESNKYSGSDKAAFTRILKILTETPSDEVLEKG